MSYKIIDLRDKSELALQEDLLKLLYSDNFLQAHIQGHPNVAITIRFYKSKGFLITVDSDSDSYHCQLRVLQPEVTPDEIPIWRALYDLALETINGEDNEDSYNYLETLMHSSVAWMEQKQLTPDFVNYLQTPLAGAKVYKGRKK